MKGGDLQTVKINAILKAVIRVNRKTWRQMPDGSLEESVDKF